jgi:hypothetical protein
MSSIFLKDCPQCATKIEATAVFCRCGFCFDPEKINNTADILDYKVNEEKVFLDYLKARVTQAEEDLSDARHRATNFPEMHEYAAEVLIAEQALMTARSDLAQQFAKYREANQQAMSVKSVARESPRVRNAKQNSPTAKKPLVTELDLPKAPIAPAAVAFTGNPVVPTALEKKEIVSPPAVLAPVKTEAPALPVARQAEAVEKPKRVAPARTMQSFDPPKRTWVKPETKTPARTKPSLANPTWQSKAKGVAAAFKKAVASSSPAPKPFAPGKKSRTPSLISSANSSETSNNTVPSDEFRVRQARRANKIMRAAKPGAPQPALEKITAIPSAPPKETTRPIIEPPAAMESAPRLTLEPSPEERFPNFGTPRAPMEVPPKSMPPISPLLETPTPPHARSAPKTKDCPNCSASVALHVTRCRCGFDLTAGSDIPGLPMSAADLNEFFGGLNIRKI